MAADEAVDVGAVEQAAAFALKFILINLKIFFYFLIVLLNYFYIMRK